MTDAEIIAWARKYAAACDVTEGRGSSLAERYRRLADLAEKASTLLDCGQGLCAIAPGCMRHWAERNRELVAELAAIRGGSVIDVLVATRRPLSAPPVKP